MRGTVMPHSGSTNCQPGCCVHVHSRNEEVGVVPEDALEDVIGEAEDAHAGALPDKCQQPSAQGMRIVPMLQYAHCVTLPRSMTTFLVETMLTSKWLDHRRQGRGFVTAPPQILVLPVQTGTIYPVCSNS